MGRLTVRRLRITRFLGVTEGFELRGLAAGVNVVWGPNASGKTTTARALEALFWPRSAAPAGAALDASVEIDDERWSIRLDTGSAEYQRDGIPASPPALPSPENRDRYRLWLPDLLRAEDTDFARSILIESSGGFDLDAAARLLGPRRPIHKQRPQQAELRQARERVRSARTAQEALSAEAATLGSMEARLAGRPELERRLRLLSVALERSELRCAAAVARDALEELPEVIGRLHGDEARRLDEITRRASEARARRAEAEMLAARAERDLRRFDLPDAIARGDLLHTLAADAERLAELDREIAELARASESAAVRLAEEEAPLEQLMEPARLASLDLPGLGEVRTWATAAEEAREARRALEAELQTLPPGPPPADGGRAQNGALLLRQWLASASVDPNAFSLRRIALAALLPGAAGAVACGVLGIYWLAALLLAGTSVLLIAILRIPLRQERRGDWEREYLRLGLLEAPDVWESAAVEGCLASLEGRIATEREMERAWHRRERITRRIQEISERQRETEESLLEVGRRFGLEFGNDPVRLLWLVDRVSRWQKARSDRLAAESALVEGFRTQQSVLVAANERLSACGLSPVSEARALKGLVEKLRQDLAQRERFSRAAEEASADAAREDRELERLAAEGDELRESIGISPSEDRSLPQWCELVGEFRSRRLASEAVDRQLESLHERLAGMAGFDPDLLHVDPELLRDEKVRLEEELESLTRLAEEVGSLRARIDAAREAHAVEDALAEETERRDALLELRAREIRAAVAAVLVDHVQAETRSDHLPRVFHRADQLFRVVTRHAYELRVDGGATIGFRAYDTRSDQSFELDQLSSGTRVQLLLAVRLAFVEAWESGVALPILMDETLANSDDERAAAIMEAVVELAAAGRQVFYFTAQPDEVAKWQRVLLSRGDLEWATVDLADVRALQNRLDLSESPPPEHPASPVIPPAASHAEIATLLPVPKVDVRAPVAAIHLWYLVDCPEVLRRLLIDLRLTRWGELSSLLRNGGDLLFERDWVERVQSLAAVSRGAIEKLGVGRGRPVDRAALVDSGAVSERFLAEVEELAVRVEGDALRVLTLLEGRAIPGFQMRKIDLLRTYFEEEGYLDLREPLRLAAVRRQLLAEHAATFGSGRVTLSDFDALLERLVRGAGRLELLAEAEEPEQSQLFPELVG